MTARGATQASHGLSRHPLYFVWKNMWRRCSIPTTNRYERYGGRGITVCQEWENISPFVCWAENNGWRPGLQLNRINNDGNYSPSNCNFVSVKENTRNRISTKLTQEIVDQIRQSVSSGEYKQIEMARMFNISPVTVHQVIYRERWDGAE